jgi:hypothetical protein
MSFTEAYADILLPFVENYKTAKNEKARKGIVETAANTILNSRNLLEEQGLELPQDLKAVCPILFFSLLSFPLTIINPGHQTVYKRVPQKTKEPHRRHSRERPKTY